MCADLVKSKGAKLVMPVTPSKLASHMKSLILLCRDGNEEIQQDLENLARAIHSTRKEPSVEEMKWSLPSLDPLPNATGSLFVDYIYNWNGYDLYAYFILVLMCCPLCKCTYFLEKKKKVFENTHGVYFISCPLLVIFLSKEEIRLNFNLSKS